MKPKYLIRRKPFKYWRGAAMIAALIALFATPNLAFSQKSMMDGRERVVTPDEISRAIGNDLHHPYLYFSSDEVPELRERIASDPVLKEIFKTMVAECNRLLYTPVEKDAPVQNKNPRFTGNWDYHRYIDAAWGNARDLAFVYQMTGETKYAEKAFEFAELVCDVPNWNDRAHMFPTIYSRIMPYNVPDDQYVFSVDLYTGHTATNLAIVYDWIYDCLDVRQRDRIRGALMEKAITLVNGNWDYHWWAWSIRCNWLTHCSSGVGMASLALLTENPELVDVVAESYNRIWVTFSEIGVDGGWQEGTGYAFNNPEWAILYGVPLKRMTGGKYTILNNPRMRDQGLNFFIWTLLPPDQKVNFGDTGSRMTRSSYIFNTFAEETQSPEVAWYATEFCGSRNSFWDIIFPPTTVEPAEPEMKSRHYRTVDNVVMRSSFTDLETVTLACKAGRHTDPHHGHLDCGDWGVHWRGESYVRGIGNIPYDEKCFDDARWTYPQAGSQGQNVIFVNGERQIPGKLRGQTMDESIGGDVLEYRYGEDREYVLMDGTNAYPKQELKGWRRHLILDKPVVTVLLDEIESAKGALIESRIHPITESTDRGAPQMQGRRQPSGNDNLMGNVTIPDDNAFVLIKGSRGMMALIAVADDPIRFVPDSHAYLPIQANATLRKIPYVDTELTASGTKTMISTIVVPVANESEARAVAQSVKRTIDRDGTLTLSFTSGNQSHEYRYERRGDGLVLAN